MFDIAAQIPPRARRVAELGDLRDRVGEAFLRMQPRAEYFGVASDLSGMREAASFLTHAFCVRPEALDLESLGLSGLDALLVRGEFIRGLTADRLKTWAACLSDKGQILLDVPNPVYIRNYLEQLAGRGSNLPGLGVPEAAELLRGAGLHSCRVGGSLDNDRDLALRQGEEGRILMESLQTALGKLGLQREPDRNPWVRSFFFKAVAEKPKEEKRLLIQTVVGETVVTPRVRLYEPHGFLATEPEVVTMFVTEDNGREIEATAARFPRKVFIRHRLHYTAVEQAFTAVEMLRRAGYLILSELDDNPNVFGKKMEEVGHLSYIGTHALQVSTKPLAELMIPFNPHVAVFRNELKELPEQRKYAAEQLKRLSEGEDYVTFFFGALNRTQEWQEVMPVISAAIEKYGSKLRFKVLSDKEFYETLPTGHKEFIGNMQMFEGQFVPYPVYQAALHSADISFLPLHDTAFNRAKSDLKFIESAGHGAVVLASPTVYEATVQHGRTGFIYRSPEEFGEYLDLLVQDRERRLAMAEAAYNYVREERMLSSHYLERLEWYQEMVDRRPELDREMVQRMRKWQEKHPGAFKAEGEKS